MVADGKGGYYPLAHMRGLSEVVDEETGDFLHASGVVSDAGKDEGAWVIVLYNGEEVVCSSENISLLATGETEVEKRNKADKHKNPLYKLNGHRDCHHCGFFHHWKAKCRIPGVDDDDDAYARMPQDSLAGQCRGLLRKMMKARNALDFCEIGEECCSSKTHLDLETITDRVETDEYASPLDFRGDMIQVFRHALEAHGENGPRYLLAKSLAQDFDVLYKVAFTEDGEDGKEVDLILGERVCKYEPEKHFQQYGVVDDVEDDKLHVIYDNGDEAWEDFPSEAMTVVRPYDHMAAAEKQIELQEEFKVCVKIRVWHVVVSLLCAAWWRG